MIEKGFDGLAGWLAHHAFELDTVDPVAPLDDLEPLREIVGDARVVAIGENAHFVREFCLLRHRVLRFLVERCGFTIHALEFGFSEGPPVDAWLQGDGADGDLEDLLGPFPCPVELRATLRWMRAHNVRAAAPVRFAGIDIPRAGGSLLPSLKAIAEYLSDADPDALPLLEPVLTLAKKIDGTSMAASAPLHSQLATAERDSLTAGVSRLMHRLRAMAPQHVERLGRGRYELAMQHLRSAAHADYNLHAMTGFLSGDGLPGDMGARDSYMADAVLWHLEQADPRARIALVAHNAHIQKVPVSYDGFLSCIPMGNRLAQTLGDAYVSLGVTSTAGNTAGLHPDEEAPHGFRVEKEALAPPVQGSIEAALAAADVGLGLVDLRDAPRTHAMPDRIRLDTAYLEIPVIDAFDGLFHVPTSTVADDIGI